MEKNKIGTSSGLLGYREGDTVFQLPKSEPIEVDDVEALSFCAGLSDLTIILNRIDKTGYESEEILPLIYDELRRYAALRMAQERRDHTLQPTALVHEAWLRLSNNGKNRTKWDNRAHFFGAAAKAMRRILIDSIRKKRSLKRGGDQIQVDIEHVELAQTSCEEKVLLIDEALSRLEAISPDKAKVVMLKYYGGHSSTRVAEILEVSERTVERHWAYCKAWLFQSIMEDVY
jgi:RNA polymerase sigma factor (TIGR02999 family)